MRSSEPPLLLLLLSAHALMQPVCPPVCCRRHRRRCARPRIATAAAPIDSFLQSFLRPIVLQVQEAETKTRKGQTTLATTLVFTRSYYHACCLLRRTDIAGG